MLTKLHLYEEVLLLALKDREGTVYATSPYQYALAGAIVAELLLGNRIGLSDPKKKRITLKDATPFSDPILDECLERIQKAKRRASLQSWVSRFSGLKRLKHRAAEQLCRRGVLRTDEGQILLIFKRKVYPEIDHGPETEITERLRQAIFTDREDLDPQTVVLVALANHADLLNKHFDKKELKGRKKRIKQITEGDAVGDATKDAITAMQAAVVAAAVIPAVITTSTGH